MKAQPTGPTGCGVLEHCMVLSGEDLPHSLCGPWAHRPGRPLSPREAGGALGVPAPPQHSASAGEGSGLRDGEPLSAQGPEQIAFLIDFSTGAEILDFNLSLAGKQAHLKLCHIVTQ